MFGMWDQDLKTQASTPKRTAVLETGSLIREGTRHCPSALQTGTNFPPLLSTASKEMICGSAAS